MKPKAWSFSSLSDFHTCPKAYYHKRIAKDVEDPPNDAGLAGDFVHKAFEAYLRDGTSLPSTYPENVRDWPQGIKPPSYYRPYLDRIAAIPGKLLAEQEYAINRKFEPVAMDAEDVWCRCIIDILILQGKRAKVIDHKTGKRKMDKRQLKLCALLVFIYHPEVDEVVTGYAWLKDRKLDKETYRREDEAELWADFMRDLVPYKLAFKLEKFVARPSGLCNGWCPVNSCDHWKPKRRR